MKIKCFALGLLFAISNKLGFAQQITTAIVSEASVDSDISDTSNFYSETYLSATEMGQFTYDFSNVGDSEITVIWQAPAGKLFALDVPSDPEWNDYNELLFELYAPGTQTTGWHLGTHGNTEVTYVEGSDILPPAGESRVTIDGTSPEMVQFFTGFFDLPPGASYRFTSVRMEIVIPASFDGDLNRDITILEAAYLLEGSDAASLPEEPINAFRLIDADIPTTLAVDNNASLSWFAIENVTYSIEATTDLGDLQTFPFTEVGTLIGQGMPAIWSDSEATSDSKFYRLVIQ